MAELSILKGTAVPLSAEGEPTKIHLILQHTIKIMEEMGRCESREITPIHGINPSGGDPCLIMDGKKLHLKVLNEKANQLGRAIERNFTATANMDRDVVIAVDLPPGFELVIALLAAWKVGAAHLPLDADIPNERVRTIIEESRPTLVIAEKTDGDRYPNVPIAAFSALQAKASELPTHDLEESPTWAERATDGEENQIAAILYTSGSTGGPKGVREPHTCALNSMKAHWRAVPYSSTSDAFVFKTNITFIVSQIELWAPLMWGKSVIILTQENVKDVPGFVHTLAQYKVEQLMVIPSYLNHSILQYLEMTLNSKRSLSLRYVITYAEPLSPTAIERFYRFFPPEHHTLLNHYGTTETMFVLYDKLSPTSKQIPLGRPYDNVNIYLLDEQLQPISKGEVGQLYVSGYISHGYVGRKMQEAFLKNTILHDPVHQVMYRTGDYARIEQGAVCYEGRRDLQIKVRGKKVNLTELENAITRVDCVNGSVVLCYKPATNQQELLTFVTVKKCETTEESIEQLLGHTLPSYMIPKVVIVSEIPRLLNGKTNRQALLQHYEESFQNGAIEDISLLCKDLSPDNEKKARAFIETITQTMKTSIKGKITKDSNFFRLGGTSLNIIETIATLRHHGYAISVTEFIRANSLMDILENMTKTLEDATDIDGSINSSQYTIEQLNDTHREDVKRILGEAFAEKGDLQVFLSVDKASVEQEIEDFWECAKESRMSMVMKNLNGDIVLASLTKDLHSELEMTETSNTIHQFEDDLARPFCDKLLRSKGPVAFGCYMGTARDVSPQQNVELAILMFEENERSAKSLGYIGMIGICTSPVTQQITVNLMKYEVLTDCQINEYRASDGSKPFAAAPDSARVIVVWKGFNDEPFENN